MPLSTTRTFPGPRGDDLHGRLELPEGPVLATALFAHCFTCSTDLRAERQLTAALSAQGIGVLSVDFTGLGRGGGDVADSRFASDARDLAAAADHLAGAVAAPSLLVGHSRAGAAALSVVSQIPSVQAVATIGAPADAGEPRERIADFAGAVLLLHSPVDEVVGIDNAEVLYRAARHPKSYVSLDHADHLLTAPREANHAASVIAAWASRYLPEEPVDPGPGYEARGATARNAGGFTTTVDSRGFRFTVDEPVESGGAQLGPTPYDHLAVALASCTVMTMRVYADRKGWKIGPLEASVLHDRVHARDCRDCETTEGLVERFDRVLSLPEGLTADQRTALLRIADRCPVHRTLEGQVEVHTRIDG